jgi:hypothetical protein
LCRSLAVQQPAFAQNVAGRPKYTNAQDKGKAAKAAKLIETPVSELTQQQQACLKFPVSLSPSCQALEAAETSVKAPSPAAPAAFSSPFGSPGQDTRYKGGSVYASSSTAKEGGGMFGFKLPELPKLPELKLPEIKIPSIGDLTGEKAAAPKPAAPQAAATEDDE